MTRKLKLTAGEQHSYAAGIDVGAEELVLVVRQNGVDGAAQKFINAPADRTRLVKKLAAMHGVIICLEATGAYHFDLSVALHDAGLKLMVVNPKASHNFAKALMKSSKTDAVDAQTLAQFAERMDFVAWTRPSNDKIVLRSLARCISGLTTAKAKAKNQLHALSVNSLTPKAVLRDAKLAITQLENRITQMNQETLAVIKKCPLLSRTLTLLTSVKGIANTSAIALMGELLLLPAGLTNREWVKFAGLNPCAFDSGKSVHKKPRLSKAGNRYIRAALYMPALSAKRHDPYVKAFFDHLVDNGKKKLQAVCAVMRKLLHAIHGMLANDQPFINSRFYRIPALPKTSD